MTTNQTFQKYHIVRDEGILHFRQWKPWKLGVNHPTIGISQKVNSAARVFRTDRIHLGLGRGKSEHFV
jgi:hypothetical protein